MLGEATGVDVMPVPYKGEALQLRDLLGGHIESSFNSVGTALLSRILPWFPISETRACLKLAWQGVTHPRWLCDVLIRTLARHGMPHFENWSGERGIPVFSKHLETNIADRGHLTWKHVADIRSRWKGRLVLKGILNPADAALARENGIDGIIVSNHGGRQLDGAVVPLRVLPAILEHFRDGPVMLDSGVRRGTDVIKAIALGATCVFIGRPFNYAASVAGGKGVEHAVSLLQQEISRNMAMMGVTSLEQLDSFRLIKVMGAPS